MSALDEFVTKARSHNDDGHNKHLAGLLELQLQLAQMQTDLVETIGERQTKLKTFNHSEQFHSTELSGSISELDQHVRSSLDALSTDLRETRPKDYVSTGETPQRKEWQYPRVLPQTAAHESIVAARRGLPDPTVQAKTPSTARTPGWSPKKQTSPRKASPSKQTSPTKAKVYTDVADQFHSHTISVKETLNELKEVDINVVPRQEAHSISFSKSIGSGHPPPLKRHATAMGSGDARKTTRLKGTVPHGLENMGQTTNTGRKLRSSPSD